LRGDLDWIVLKSLEKDRSRRYTSAAALADDLDRHLSKQPVLAGPPSRVYQLRKFVSRNRVPVVAVLCVMAALLLGIIGIFLGMLEAGRQRDSAQREAANVREVTDFLIGLMTLADPKFAMSPEVSVRALLDRAASEVTGAFEGLPEAEARVRSTMGQAYLSLGEHPPAELHLKRAVELLESQPVVDLGEYYTVLWALVNVSFKMERTDSFQWAGRARKVGHDFVRVTHPDLAAALDDFHSRVEQSAHKAEPAPLLAAAALVPGLRQRARSVLPPRDPKWKVVSDTLMAGGYWLWYTPHEPVAAEFFAAALEIQERELEPGHPSVSECLAMLVGMYSRAGRFEESTQRLQGSVDRLREILAPDNFQRAFVESMLGDNLVGLGRFEEAEELLLAADEVIQAHVPRVTDFYAIDSITRIIRMYDQSNQQTKALPYRDELVRRSAATLYLGPWILLRPAFPPDQEDLVRCVELVREPLGEFGYRLDTEEQDVPGLDLALQEWVALRQQKLAADQPRAVVLARVLLMHSYAVNSKSEVARIMASEAHDILLQWREQLPLDLGCAAARLAEVELERGHRDVAAGLIEDAIRLSHEASFDDNWMLAVMRARMGRAVLKQGLYGPAESLLLPARDLITIQLGPQHHNAREANRLLVELYQSWGRPERARAYSQEEPESTDES
jgi:tetratricopeptide (TPR) repeat protein